MNCDLIICTKNRTSILKKTISNVKSKAAFNRTIIVESSQSPNKKFLEKIADCVLYTPDAKLGKARQMGLLASESEYVFFLDDDHSMGSLLEYGSKWLFFFCSLELHQFRSDFQ